MTDANRSQTVARRTKILATLGPASADDATVAAMVQAGLDAARVNGSHGQHADHAASIARVRAAGAAAGRRIGVLFDLQGPKIRVADFDGPALQIREGQQVRIAVGRDPEAGEVPSGYDRLDHDVLPGHPLLIDDGAIALQVTEVTDGTVTATCRNDGLIRPRKGINLPGGAVSAPAITDKDRADALFAAGQGVDLIALSFVRRADDVRELQQLMKGAGHTVPIIAKIEKPHALEHLEEITRVSWGVMVARGDLGVELSPEEVPVAQKRIISLANRLARPVITATQMLESMTRNPRPTRAEASDVANAVLDGTDTVMLSAETAVGRYPVDSVAMMDRVIRKTEEIAVDPVRRRRTERDIDGVPEAVADACCHAADHLAARCIAVFTSTGSSALLVAQRRPRSPVYAFSPDPAVGGRMALVRGLHPMDGEAAQTVDERVSRMDQALVAGGHAGPGDRVVICMGAPGARPGSTDVMLVHRVGDGRRSA